MAIHDEIKDEKLNYDINREAATISALILFRMDPFGDAHRCKGNQKALLSPPSNLSHIPYNDETWYSCTLPERESETYKRETNALSCSDSSIFSSDVRKLCYIKKYRYRLHLWYKISNSFNWLWVVKDIANKIVTILIRSAKLATAGLLKIKTFWNKYYEVIICKYDVTNKIVSSDSNYVVDVVMWPKFSNSSFLW